MICKACNRDRPNTAFELLPGGTLRHTCESCRGKARRGTGARALAEARERRTVFASRAREAALQAALNENERLRKEVDAVTAVRPLTIGTIPCGGKTSSEAVACVVTSDLHVDEVVEPGTVNGLNEYNPDIAKARMEAFFRNSLKLAQGAARDSEIKVLYWAILGDLFSGWIHDELIETNSMSPVDAAQFVGDLLASGLAYWLRHSKFKIVGDMVVGNHGRLTKRLRSAPVGTSLESVVYRRLADAFRDEPRVQLTAAPGGRTYRRFGELTMRLCHGYEVGYQGGVGGVSIPIRKKVAQWDKAIKADLTVMGHFHQLLNGGDFLVNGSVIGYSAYAEFLAASPEPPRQAFFLVHAKRGLSLTAPVWVTP